MQLMLEEVYVEIQRHETRADETMLQLREKEKMLLTCTNDLTTIRSKVGHCEKIEMEMEKTQELIAELKDQLNEARDDVGFPFLKFKISCFETVDSIHGQKRIVILHLF
jgi:predicted RNase H-like nuclease (RuvC/YqgF family)